MARELNTFQKSGLSDSKVHTTLKVTLVNGSVLFLSTREVMIGDDLYEAKLKPTSALRMLLTKAIDKVTFEIQNQDLILGHKLIKDTKVFQNSFAIWGAIHNPPGGQWHDEKIVGTIKNAEIMGDKILCKFVSGLDDGVYSGVAINSVFTGLPPLAVNNNNLGNVDIGILDDIGRFSGIGRGRIDYYEDFRYGRYYLPEEDFVS